MEAIISNTQAKRDASIPEQWRLPKNAFDPESRPIDVFKQPGLLTDEELEITGQNAIQLLEMIHSGSLSAVAATQAFAKRAAIAHQVVNCFTEFFPDEALKRAKELDGIFAKTGKPVGVLHGLPIAIKDMYDVAGHLTTVGYVSWHDNVASTDASLVKVMKDAGAVIFAKTTMPQTGMALETYSNLWGRTLNTYSTKFGSGGSSGGDGVLVGLRGVAAAPLASDIGGSIRAPAAFNGLYGMRPTSERIPRKGLRSTVPGQISIKTSCGPISHSMPDLKLLIKLILSHPSLPFEGSCPPGWWNEVKTPKGKLRIGLILTDGVVDPHPPVARALKETAEKLKAAGHDVFEYKLPFDAWEAALTTWALYWQTGAAEANQFIASSGESPLIPYARNLEIFKTRALTTQELFSYNAKQLNYKWEFAQSWQDNTSSTDAGPSKAVDAIICPVAPAASIPHSFPVWWGYTSLWNLLDYPSVIVPVKDLVIDPIKDKKDLNYQPRDNPFDKDNWEVYDPELWKTQPVTIQVVGRPYKDEDLVAAAEVIDQVING
ncbi:hypothetical protein B0A52_07835 [Exophiala mesophila]|uniref:Amidase domain-containing protein n=1 Tax=Exophiala mesophila TaxID=212818 RepID=A0A438MVD0_EXOME|nr:hypothetical protein B0A52_07835 [Exophiala mesophila]